MISIQRLLGRPALFFGLLTQSARLGTASAAGLKEVFIHLDQQPSLEAVAAVRRQEKEVHRQMEESLSRTGVTPIEREDIAEVAESLYRLPKTVESVIERYAAGWNQVQGIDFSHLAGFVERAAKVAEEMVGLLARGGTLAECKVLEARLSQMEADAGYAALREIQALYAPGTPALRTIIAKDLYDRILGAIEACRSVGRTAGLVIMRNS